MQHEAEVWWPLRRMDASCNLDMNQTCPGKWQSITTPRRLCLENDPGCHSATFPALNVAYEHAYLWTNYKAFQKGTTDAFNVRRNSVNSQYVDNISVTLGPPCKHMWTFASGIRDHVS